MGEQPYLQRRAAQTHESLSPEATSPGRRQSTTLPTTVAYATHDHPVTSYASMPALGSYHLTYESSLPTPEPIPASDPRLERSSPKMCHIYANDGRNSQQPTPPGTARPSAADWNDRQAHHMMSASQSASPMDIPSPQNMLDMHGLDTPPHHNLPVTTADAPYWGSFGVSAPDQPDQMSPSMQSQAIFGNVSNVMPSALIKSTIMPPSQMTLASAPGQVPLLNHGPNTNHLGASANQIDDFSQHYGSFSPQPMYFDPQYPYKLPMRRSNQRSQPKKRSRGPPKTQASRQMSQGAANRKSPAASRTSLTESMIHTLQLSDDAPEECKRLWELRRKHKGSKGKNMWEEIGADWDGIYTKKDRPALQMQLKRIIGKYVLWPAFEDKALQAAVAELDAERYTRIIELMKKHGGCLAWEWKPYHVAKRLYEIGEEDFDPFPKECSKKEYGKAARRARKEAKRREEDPNLFVAPMPPAGAIYDDDGVTLHTRNSMTSEQDEALFNMMCKTEVESPEAGDTDFDLMQGLCDEDPSASGLMGSSSVAHAQSERVARQACEQLIAAGQQHPQAQQQEQQQHAQRQQRHSRRSLPFFNREVSH